MDFIKEMKGDGEEEHVRVTIGFMTSECDGSQWVDDTFVHFPFADFNLAYIQRYGLSQPLLFREMTGLGMKVPDQSFTVNDVRVCVGE